MKTFKQYLSENRELPYAIFTMDMNNNLNAIWIRVKDDMYEYQYANHPRRGWIDSTLEHNPNNWVSYRVLMDRDKNYANPFTMSRDKFEEFALTEIL